MTREPNRSRATIDQDQHVRTTPPSTADDETSSAIEQMLANPDDRLGGRIGLEVTAPSRADRCSIMRGMLVPLDTLTTAGQRHQMTRLIDALATETDGEVGRVGSANRLALQEQLDRLRQDAARTCPDAGSFRHRAEALITMLESVA